MGKKLSRKPQIGKDLTLGELRKIVEEADLMGFGDNVTPHVRINWNGCVKEIEFDDDRVVKPKGAGPDRAEMAP